MIIIVIMINKTEMEIKNKKKEYSESIDEFNELNYSELRLKGKEIAEKKMRFIMNQKPHKIVDVQKEQKKEHQSDINKLLKNIKYGNLSCHALQKEIEKTSYSGFEPYRLANTINNPNESITYSVKIFNIFVKKMLSEIKRKFKKENLHPELNIIDHDTLTNIALNITTKMFIRGMTSDGGMVISRSSWYRLFRLSLFKQSYWLQKLSSIRTEDPDFKLTGDKYKMTYEKSINFLILDTYVGLTLCQIVKEKTYYSGIKKRRIVYLELSKNWSDYASSNIDKMINLPLVVEPLSWILDEKKNLVKGGLLCNIQGIQKSLLANTKDSTWNFTNTKESQNNINYLQSIPYSIDRKTLTLIMNDKNKYIKKYKMYQDFVNNFEENFNKADSKKEKIGIVELNKKYKMLIEKIHLTIKIAFHYVDRKIYFIYRFDGRGRIYSAGWPITLQGDNLSRSLIDSGTPYTFSRKQPYWHLFKKIMSRKMNVKLESFKKNPGRHFDKNFFEDLSFIKYKELYFNKNNQTSALIGLDATASGFQIMGILVGDEDVLIKTGVFKSDSNIDIYGSIHKEVKDSFPDVEFVNNMPRKIYKKILMQLSYGQSNYKRSILISDYLKENYIDIKPNFKLCFQIAFKYSEILQRDHPLIHYLIKTVRQIGIEKEQTPILFDVNRKVLSSSQYYREDKKTSYTYIDDNANKRSVQIYLPNTDVEWSAKPSENKAGLSTLPNFIHHLDSLITHSVVSKFRYEKKKIFTVHDAFYVQLDDIYFLQDSYFKALKEISEINPLKKFFSQNVIKDSPYILRKREERKRKKKKPKPKSKEVSAYNLVNEHFSDIERINFEFSKKSDNILT